MKLRNKKTGESGELHYYPDKPYHFAVSTKDPTQMGIYKTLGELLQDWTDFIVHVPTEPLIKDEKIRKAVRSWFEANDLDGATYYTSSHHWYLRAFNDREQGIDFCVNWENKPNLIENKYYTKTELCGEEE